MITLSALVAFVTLPILTTFAVLKDPWTKQPVRAALFLLSFLVLPGAAAAQVSASPSQLQFGAVPLGGTSAPHSIQLTNSGPATVYLSYPAITGVFVSDFSVSTDCPMFNAALSQIEAGASCNFSLE